VIWIRWVFGGKSHSTHLRHYPTRAPRWSLFAVLLWTQYQRRVTLARRSGTALMCPGRTKEGRHGDPTVGRLAIAKACHTNYNHNSRCVVPSGLDQAAAAPARVCIATSLANSIASSSHLWNRMWPSFAFNTPPGRTKRCFGG
jgi:hypothetical protein